jgi:hypothetical protein
VSISPFAAVLEMAPAKVLHGAVRLHGLASSPTPETQVRVAWARATDGNTQRAVIIEANAAIRALRIIYSFLLSTVTSAVPPIRVAAIPIPWVVNTHLRSRNTFVAAPTIP